MKVLALIDHLALGGAEVLLSRFAAVSAAAGIDLRVACLEERAGNPVAALLRAAGVEPTVIGPGGRPSVGQVAAVRQLIQRIGPDIVHTHLGTSDFVGGLAARSLGTPVVSTIHAIAQRRRGAGAIKPTVFMLTQRLCADRVICVSHSARRAYVEQFGASRRVVVLHNGLDLEPAPGAGARIREELGLRPTDAVVGMVSALRPEKAHDLAIASLELLRETDPNARLLIVGDGPSRASLEALAAPLGGAVVFAGVRHDLAAVFDAIDVCLHPSRLDALPTTLIEALAASVPVIATDVGGISEIIENDRTGALVPATVAADELAGVLSAMLAEPGRRRALAEAGRRAYLERFTAAPWAVRSREVYEEVIAERSTASS